MAFEGGMKNVRARRGRNYHGERQRHCQQRLVRASFTAPWIAPGHLFLRILHCDHRNSVLTSSSIFGRTRRAISGLRTFVKLSIIISNVPSITLYKVYVNDETYYFTLTSRFHNFTIQSLYADIWLNKRYSKILSIISYKVYASRLDIVIRLNTRHSFEK